MRIKPILLAAALVLPTAACAAFEPAAPANAYSRDVGELVYRAADRMIDASEMNTNVSMNKPIVVATSVNVDDLQDSSTFGRLASQLVASRLAQRGYLVRDVTYTRALTMTAETGEMVLSRETSKLAAEYGAQAVVAGAYAVGGEKIYLNLRLLNAADGRVLSTVDVAVPLNEDTQRMIVTGRNDLQRRAALEH